MQHIQSSSGTSSNEEFDCYSHKFEKSCYYYIMCGGLLSKRSARHNAAVEERRCSHFSFKSTSDVDTQMKEYFLEKEDTFGIYCTEFFSATPPDKAIYRQNQRRK